LTKKNLWAPAIALGIALSSPQITPMLQAQAQAQGQEPSAPQSQQKSQVFAGKIIKAKNGQYALLTDEQAGKGAFLDDQDKAKQFEGKNVKVTGVLEASRGLIHVTDIQAA
jgi:hypothetical protein